MLNRRKPQFKRLMSRGWLISLITLFACFGQSVYFSCISDRNWFILHKFHRNYPSQYIDHLPHLRIYSLYRYVPKDQQFITSAHINDSPIEGITPIKHALGHNSLIYIWSSQALKCFQCLNDISQYMDHLLIFLLSTCRYFI